MYAGECLTAEKNFSESESAKFHIANKIKLSLDTYTIVFSKACILQC